MKLALANRVRAEIIDRLFKYLEADGEDVGMITSNTLNFPYTLDGEECFIEVTAKVVKKDSEECYQERTDYQNRLVERAEKAAARENAAAEKKAKAEAKKKEKEKAE